ncbi:MAG: hypothetical protein QW103_00005 [Candidatus Pacearchaeota archaeon]
MKLLRKAVLSLILSFILLYLSFYFPLIPCKTKQNIIGIPSSWDLCSFSFTGQFVKENLYFGSYPPSFETFFILLFVYFILIFVILSFVFKKRKN